MKMVTDPPAGALGRQLTQVIFLTIAFQSLDGDGYTLDRGTTVNILTDFLAGLNASSFPEVDQIIAQLCGLEAFSTSIKQLLNNAQPEINLSDLVRISRITERILLNGVRSLF